MGSGVLGLSTLSEFRYITEGISNFANAKDLAGIVLIFFSSSVSLALVRIRL